MKQNQKRNAKGRAAKSVLRLPDLEVAKSAVLKQPFLSDAQRGYRHAIDEFVDWYCSEPRLSFSKTVVLRYRMHLESRNLTPGTVNLRLGAVRRLAYEAADCGLWCQISTLPDLVIKFPAPVAIPVLNGRLRSPNVAASFALRPARIPLALMATTA
jgi:hypothetical protein